jgi:hypothetical protein
MPVGHRTAENIILSNVGREIVPRPRIQVGGQPAIACFKRGVE